jgi:hypothetical protein
MRLLPLVWKILGRRKVRTLFTALSIAVKGLPLLGRELAASRVDQAVRAADGATLRRELDDAAELDLAPSVLISIQSLAWISTEHSSPNATA